MAVLPTAHSVQDHDTTQTEFELLPTGNYSLEIIASELKNDDNQNLSVNLTYSVVEPEEYANRRFFGWIDYQHSDVKKQEDGQREISRLCRACEYDKPHLEDTEDLHLVKFMARVENSPAGVSKAGRPYKAKNRIKKYFFPDEGALPVPAIDAVQPTATKPVAANQNKPAAAPAAAKPAGAKPWGAKKAA